jgi:hypothetical protein
MTHTDPRFYIAQLRDAGILNTPLTGFAYDADGYIGLIFTKPDASRVVIWLYSDDEGNAPGSFEIQHAAPDITPH